MSHFTADRTSPAVGVEKFAGCLSKADKRDFGEKSEHLQLTLGKTLHRIRQPLLRRLA